MIKEIWDQVANQETYQVWCDGDDCEVHLNARSSEAMAIVNAAAAGWDMRVPEQKFSGVALRDYCPACKNKE